MACKDIQTYPANFVLSSGAGINECLGNDAQVGIHIVRDSHIKNELWVLECVHPEAK